MTLELRAGQAEDPSPTFSADDAISDVTTMALPHAPLAPTDTVSPFSGISSCSPLTRWYFFGSCPGSFCFPSYTRSREISSTPAGSFPLRAEGAQAHGPPVRTPRSASPELKRSPLLSQPTCHLAVTLFFLSVNNLISHQAV